MTDIEWQARTEAPVLTVRKHLAATPLVRVDPEQDPVLIPARVSEPT